MPEQASELRRIHWPETFPFTNVFRTFKLAIHPTKLVVALAAIVATGIWGWVLDGVWGKRQGPLVNEINASWQVKHLANWRKETLRASTIRIRGACEYAELTFSPEQAERFVSEPTEVANRLLDDIVDAADLALEKQAANLRSSNKSQAEQHQTLAELARKYQAAYERVRESAPTGIFRGLVSYEVRTMQRFVHAACNLNFAGGLGDLLAARHSGRNPDGLSAMMRLAMSDAGMGGHSPPSASEETQEMGMLACVVLMLHGLCWLVSKHFIYALVFGLPVLAIWALAAGAICRMAAMGFARREQISLKTALVFARRKWAGLFTAPLFPVMLIIGIGALMILGGFVTAIPVVGELLFVIFLILALPGGLLMAGVGIGGVAGGSLMWPTIAVEGSDSFDAMSRTYSYVYTRPWKAAFYGLALAVYGAICYLFVRFFLLIALKAIRFFLGVGLMWTDRPGLGDPAATKLDSLWPMPTFGHFRTASVPIGTQGTEAFATFLVFLWVTLIVALLYAFVVSFWMSGSTIVYCLLRREVDATDYEDVYLEEDEEEDAGPIEVGKPAAAEPAPPPVGGETGGDGGPSHPQTPPKADGDTN